MVQIPLECAECDDSLPFSGASSIPLLHDHPFCLCCPNALSMVGDSLSGNGCGSPNHIQFYLLNLLLIN